MAGPKPRATISTIRGVDYTSMVAFKVNGLSGFDAK